MVCDLKIEIEADVIALKVSSTLFVLFLSARLYVTRAPPAGG